MKTTRYHKLIAAVCALALLLVLVPPAYAADESIYQPNPDCGTYLGQREDGVFEFEATIPDDMKSYPTPLLPAHYYPEVEVYEQSSEYVIGIRSQYFYGMTPGTATVGYTVYQEEGEVPHLKAIVYITVVPRGEYDPSVNKGFAYVQPPEPGTGTDPDPDTPEPSDPGKPADLPTSATPHMEYSLEQIIGGNPSCKHNFDSYTGRKDILSTCSGYGYTFVPCQHCNAYQCVGILYPSSYNHNYVNGTCTWCGKTTGGSNPDTPTPPEAGSDIKPNSSFGTYIGTNSNGVDEFRLTLASGARETKLPMTSTQNYQVKPVSSNSSVAVWDQLTIVAKDPGTSTLTYNYIIDGKEVPKAIVYLTVTGSSSSDSGSDIKPNSSFGTYVGKNSDGVDEFKLTLASGAKETGLPMTSTQNYQVNTSSSNASVAVWDKLTIVAKDPGTSILTYNYVIDGKEVPKAIVYLTVTGTTSSADGSDIKPNPSFGTYVGKNSSGVDEFKLTLTPGAKETKLPMTSTQNYQIKTLSSNTNVAVWDQVTIVAKAAGTATLTYNYVINGKEVPKAIVYLTVEAGTETPPAAGSNGAAYSKRNGMLGPRPDGGCDLIWLNGKQVKVTSYDASFKETGSQPVTMELPTLKSGYWGEKYNFLIFAQSNAGQSDSKEVFRIVKFSKDWKRLGAASIYGANTTIPVSSGNLSFAEAGDMLYIHTCHQMYAGSDGVQHQANMTVSIRQSDMTVTDSRHNVAYAGAGYCSHSFAQDVLVDQEANLITLDLGDAYPRGAMLFRYSKKAGADKFAGSGTPITLKTWPGATGANNTGSRTCALAETSQGYLSAYLDSGKGSSFSSRDPYNLYLAFTPKSSFSASATRTRTVVSGSSSETPVYAYLFPTSPESGYVLWFSATRGQYSWSSTYKVYYAMYSADGSVGQATSLGEVPTPVNGPVYDGNRIIWSGKADVEKGLEFYTVDSSGLKVIRADGELAGKQEETPNPGPTDPGPVDPGPDKPGTGKTPFTDVPDNAYYADAVAWALKQGITTGVTATTFAPNSACTRAQVATFLWRAKGCPEPATKNSPFQDVRTSDYYFKAVLWAYEQGITTGETATTFGPDATCTNGHVLTFLWRANGEPKASGSSSLANSYPGAFYTKALAWADTAGLLANTGAFNPNSRSSRCNIVTYLYRDLAE